MSPTNFEGVDDIPMEPNSVATLVIKPPAAKRRRGAQFWLIFLAVAVSMFQAGFELCAVSTALPTIASELKSNDFVWVGSAYALASACSIPMAGGLVQAFGRQHIMLGAITIFAVGSAVCGAATSMAMLIGGRTVQGFGGGIILALAQIIVSDLVSLRERGTFNGLLGITWTIAIVTSAVTGGVLAEHGVWRWIFYLNLPISAFAFALVLIFLKTRVPRDNLRAKLGKLDWIGNFIIIASTVSISIAITEAGVKHPWSSVQVLVPLCVGVAGLCGFFAYEALVAQHPLVPFHLLSNRTSAIGYFSTFMTNLVVVTCIYYLPVYLQACKGDTPIQSGGLDWVGVSVTVGPMGIVAGITVTLVKKYRPIIWFGFAFQIAAMYVFSIFPVHATLAKTIGFEVVLGVGIGTLLTTTYFPVLAPLPVSSNARALAFFSFCRVFAQIWAVTIGASVLQNELQHRLPPEFLAQLPAGIQLTYSAIPQIPNLPPDLQLAVRTAFSGSLTVLWRVMIGFAGFAFVVSLFMKEVPMHAYTDDDWGLETDKPTLERSSSDRTSPSLKAPEIYTPSAV